MSLVTRVSFVCTETVTTLLTCSIPSPKPSCLLKHFGYGKNTETASKSARLLGHCFKARIINININIHNPMSLAILKGWE